MYGYIYLTTNLINNKKYIGKKKSDIFLGNKYLGSGIALNSAIEKYGRSNFTVELVDMADSLEELNEKEKFYIEKYNAVLSEEYYNIANGGDGGIVWGTEENHPSKHTDRAGEKNPSYGKHWYTNGEINIYLRETDIVPDGFYRGCTRIRGRKKGCFKHSDETKKKISKSLKGRKMSPESIEKIKNYYLNMTDEQKNIRSENCRKRQLGKKYTDEHKNNISKALKGRVKSKEECENISKRQKERFRKLKENNININFGYNQTGTTWVHRYIDGIKECHMVKQEELENYLNNGYTIGRGKIKKQYNDN